MGEIDGAIVGEVVGAFVGVIDGAIVGAIDGAGVGLDATFGNINRPRRLRRNLRFITLLLITL